MTLKLNATFAKQTKDSKKEGLVFHVTGEQERNPEINAMVREVVILSLGFEDDAVELSAEFVKASKDPKKTSLEFNIKGDTSADKSFEFYKHAGKTVDLNIKPSQMSIEEFKESAKGKSFEVDGDGVVQNVEQDPDQVDLFEQGETDQEEDGETETDGMDIPELDGEE